MAKHFIALCALSAVAACSSRGGSYAPAAPTAAAMPQSTTASFTIAVPRAASTASNARTPQYVSSATQSVIITLSTVGGTAYTGAAASIATNLTASNPACSSSTGALTCSASAPAVAGSDVFSVATYDAQQTSSSPATPAGHLLSQSTIAITVVAGQANAPTTPLVLNAVPASVVVTSADAHITGTQAAGFAIIGARPATLSVVAKDAGGATIIGAGAPTFMVTSGSAAVQVSAVSGGTATLTAKSYSATPVNLTVTPSTGAAAMVAFTTVSEMWALAYSAPSTYSVVGYALVPGAPANIPSDTITDAAWVHPLAIALDPAGDVWVANCNATCSGAGPDTILEYTAGHNTSSAATISAGVSQPQGIAFDASGHLWVSNDVGNQLTEYAPPANTVIATAGAGQENQPWGIAFDVNGKLWVADTFNHAAEQFAATGGASLATVPIAPSGQPAGLAFDAAGNLWESNVNGGVREYAAGTLLSGPTVLTTVTSDIVPVSVAFDGVGNLWVTSSVGAPLIRAYDPTNSYAQIVADAITFPPSVSGLSSSAIAP